MIDVNKNDLGWNKNTELCVDVKTFLLNDTVAQIGKIYLGAFTRDKADHFQFLETVTSAMVKRNPHAFTGDDITATVKDDGTPCLNFKALKLTADFNIDAYAITVCNEIRKVLYGLLGKDKLN